MRLEKGTWVLVLDGAKGLILEAVGDGPDLALRVLRKDQNDATDSRGEATAPAEAGWERGQGRPPRSTADATHETTESGFAEEMAEWLNRAALRGRFERLVLVAPPKVLGTLRQELHKEASDRVVGEIPKTLTGHPVDRIERIVMDELSAA